MSIKSKGDPNPVPPCPECGYRGVVAEASYSTTVTISLLEDGDGEIADYEKTGDLDGHYRITKIECGSCGAYRTDVSPRKLRRLWNEHNG